MITETAPAKVNLYLHVGGVRTDGLHNLESLFIFLDAGDVVHVSPSDDLSLKVTGPYAAALSDLAPECNLVYRAAARLRSLTGIAQGATITLEKNLPIASGVGGGSADAAAALRALTQLWRTQLSPARLAALAFDLGADVPACLVRAPVQVSGAGERLSPGPRLPPLWATLVNPRVDMPTGPVFRAFDRLNPAPPEPFRMNGDLRTYGGLAQALSMTRNDLESPACAIAPIIDEVVDYLTRMPGAIAARMSGSGATCFVLFASKSAAIRAHNRARGRGWWSLAGAVHS